MKIHHLRNATFVVESGANHLLIDPMLAEKGELPPFTRFRYPPNRNPTVPLPQNASVILNRVTHCLITHSQAFGIKALQHTDHLDPAGDPFLRNRNTPVVCKEKDAACLRKYGINVQTVLNDGRTEPLLDGEITAVPARHEHGWIHHLMANGAGYFLRLSGEPSIYISGDTVYTKEVERVLTEFKPDIAVVAAGSARLDVGKPILMSLDEIVSFVRAAPHRVIANHLEALNHCPTTRLQLKHTREGEGLLSKTFISEDGETLILEE